MDKESKKSSREFRRDLERGAKFRLMSLGRKSDKKSIRALVDREVSRLRKKSHTDIPISKTPLTDMLGKPEMNSRPILKTLPLESIPATVINKLWENNMERSTVFPHIIMTTEGDIAATTAQFVCVEVGESIMIARPIKCIP